MAKNFAAAKFSPRVRDKFAEEFVSWKSALTPWQCIIVCAINKWAICLQERAFSNSATRSSGVFTCRQLSLQTV